jgi:hypothetical protein
MPGDTPGDVKLPLFGDVPKKYAIGGGLAAAAVVVIVIVRNRNAAAAAPADTTTTDATGDADDSDTDDSGIDPATGIPYADETGDDSGDDYGDIDAEEGIDPNTGIPYADEDGGSGGITGTTGTAITTNDEWVSEGMSDLPGSQATIQAALTAVLGGLTVTTAQRNLFLEAVGVNGQPPQGYPQPIKTSDTGAQPKPPAGKTPVPNVVGQPQEAAFALLSQAGFKPTGTKVIHGETLIVRSQTPKARASAAKGSTVRVTSTPAPKPKAK